MQSVEERHEELLRWIQAEPVSKTKWKSRLAPVPSQQKITDFVEAKTVAAVVEEEEEHSQILDFETPVLRRRKA
jgi:hypothetical protein